ncbi:MAG: CdaR family protein [Erysipelotrichaceae bacterium]|nr:CdaR family protein [Erysipelotrichaceae bacterium]
MDKNNNKVSIEKTENAKKIANKNANTRGAYEGMEEGILKFFRWISGIFDRLFLSTKYSALFALCLACLAYFVATYDDSNTALTSSKVLSNISINSRYNSESFELTGVPQACEVVITGEAANVTNAAAKKGYCQIDLEGYTEGTHTVKMSAVGYGDSVTSIVSPSEVTITLKKKTTKQFDLSYDYINQNNMDSKYVLGTPQFNQGSKINIRASQDTLNSIALVKALIDVGGATGDFETEAPIVAYDKNGKAINAEIVPEKVKVTVKVSSPSNEVAIKLNPTGQPPVGLAIDEAVITDHQTTRIYGPQSVIDSISELYVNFDMSTISENASLELILPVTLPSGVNASDVSVVNVKVSLAAVEETTLYGIPLNAINNTENLGISEIDYTEVNVIVSGSEKNIDAVDPNEINVYFEMPKEVGTYDIPLYVESKNNPYVNLKLEIGSVHVTVVEANS